MPYKYWRFIKRLHCITVIFIFALFTTFCGQTESPKDKTPKNTTGTIEQRVENLLSRMSLEEKIDQLSGLGFTTKPDKRLGIPALIMADGPVGVRWGYATAFPSGTGIAASWDPALTEKIGATIADEMKSKGRNLLLAPCVNIHRHPLGGRNFESYGEDPFLAARTAVAFIKGVQSKNVLACVKHFACNNQEWRRQKVNVGVDERGLREIYLPAFKAAVKEAGVMTVMAAYNSLRGRSCSENKYLLNDVLKKEWGFKGFVISDWWGTYSTVNAANAGLDLEMPAGKFFGPKLLEAVKKGEVTEETINDKIRRLLRVRFKAGLFDSPATTDDTVINRESHKKLALEAARAGIVLMKNKNNLLPLDTKKIKSIAVIGPNAMEARTGGGRQLHGGTPLQCVTHGRLEKSAGQWG